MLYYYIWYSAHHNKRVYDIYVYFCFFSTVVKEKCALLDSEQPKLDSVIKEGDDSPVSPPFDNELSDSGFLPDDNNGYALCVQHYNSVMYSLARATV